MLSFLKEHNNINDKDINKDKSVENKDSQKCTTLAARQEQLKKTTRLLLIVFGIGVFCLWFMIAKSGPQTASANINEQEEAEMEIAIAKIIGVKSELNTGTIELMKKFGELSNVKQLKLSELAKNPFETEQSFGDMSAACGFQGQAMTNSNSEYNKRLHLLSIMYSENGNYQQCCMINDTILYEGDAIEGFLVRQIKDKQETINVKIPIEEAKISTQVNITDNTDAHQL